MHFVRQTLTTTLYTEAQQDANWDNLSSEQRAYFNHLADGDPERTGQAFFEDTVPVQLQDDPQKLEVFLNGGTVTTTEYDYTRGRDGGIRRGDEGLVFVGVGQGYSSCRKADCEKSRA